MPAFAINPHASATDKQPCLGAVQHREETILLAHLCGRDLAADKTRLVVLPRKLLLAAAIFETGWRSIAHAISRLHAVYWRGFLLTVQIDSLRHDDSLTIRVDADHHVAVQGCE
jgi:hypothetical protein